MGGTVLGSSRGGFDMEKTIEFLRKSGVNQLYIVGGDGTHRGAYKLSQECAKRGLNVAVAGIPKVPTPKRAPPTIIFGRRRVHPSRAQAHARALSLPACVGAHTTCASAPRARNGSESAARKPRRKGI